MSETTPGRDDTSEYILLTLLQIRDMMGMSLMIAAAGDKRLSAQVDALEKLHESGKLLLDMPYIAAE